MVEYEFSIIMICFTEFFSATEADVARVLTSHGQTLKEPTSGPGSCSPITLGCVGIWHDQLTTALLGRQ
eukprot:14074098-Ditylum_brightwellii.AAC.1